LRGQSARCGRLGPQPDSAGQAQRPSLATADATAVNGDTNVENQQKYIITETTVNKHKKTNKNNLKKTMKSVN
jgi:hypothetical protein